MISLLKQDPFNKTVLLVGLSTDEKPTDFFAYKGASIPILNGSMFYEADEGIFYLFDAANEEWIEQAGGGGGYPEPEGSITITQNGTYNVKRKAQAIVACPEEARGFIERTHVSVSNSQATMVADRAFFQDAEYLKEVNLPAVTQIGLYAFYDCNSLEEINAPLVVFIGGNAFYGTKVRKYSFPVLTSIGEYAFSGNRQLTSIYAPLLSTVGSNAFTNCTSLQKIKLESLGRTSNYGFYGCTRLKEADFPVITNIDASAFGNCSLLDTVILRKTDSICILASSSAFGQTPIMQGNGYIYAPSALIDSYKQGTNWSMLPASIWRALEDYTVDGTTTGDLDPSKI